MQEWAVSWPVSPSRFRDAPEMCPDRVEDVL